MLRDVTAENLKRTPLYEFHARNGARFVPFGGWEMPVQYTGILDEHLKVRSVAGLFDVSHMGEALVKGPDAGRFLDYVLTNRIGSIGAGRAVYSVMCNESGGVVDDLITYCIHQSSEYLVCLNASNTAKDIAWMRQYADAFDCVVEDVSTTYAQLALQGPAAFDILQKATGINASGMRRFAFEAFDWNGEKVLVARTGYTGEDGVEVYLAAQLAENFADALLPELQRAGGVLAGLGARDSLRLEAGYPLYGHELGDAISPLEAGLHWTVKWDKDVPFVGQPALEAEKERGPARRLVHYVVDDRRIPRPGTEVCVDAGSVGEVVSGTQSPILGKPIGSALVANREYGVQDLFVEVRGKRIPLLISSLPLHKVAASK